MTLNYGKFSRLHIPFNYITLFVFYLKCYSWDEGRSLSPNSESHLALEYIRRPDEKAFQRLGRGKLVNNIPKVINSMKQMSLSYQPYHLCSLMEPQRISFGWKQIPGKAKQKTESSKVFPASYALEVPKTLGLPCDLKQAHIYGKHFFLLLCLVGSAWYRWFFV